MECAEGGQVREQQRLRVRHGVPDVKMVVFVKTQTLTAELMTQVLSHTRKIHVCGSAECAPMWCSVYTSPSLTRESTLLVSETPCNWDKKVKRSLFIPTRCLAPSDDCHHDEEELDEEVEKIPFPSGFRVNSFGFFIIILRKG